VDVLDEGEEGRGDSIRCGATWISDKKKCRVYQEGADSTFSSNGKTYSVDKMLQLGRKKKVQTFSVSSLDWILDEIGDDTEEDRHRTSNADLSKPIIVTTEGGRLVVADGIHRLKKGISTGAKEIKGVYLTPEEMKESLMDTDKYDSSEVLREDAPRPEWLRLPFDEAIVYFRSKVSIPTKSFKKMEEGYHDWAFSITGITKGSLLDDARWLIDKAIADGTSFDTFKKQWNRLIGRKGWQPKGDKNRRLYIIYDTNVRSAYGAGRGQQMSDPDVADKRPYILWRHRDSPNPRVNHQQLDNKAIALSDPFWNKVNAPAGFSCRCGLFSVTKEYCDRNGVEILDNPPDPLTIAEPGFRRPLRGMTDANRKEVIFRTLDNLTPETKAIVEKELESRR